MRPGKEIQWGWLCAKDVAIVQSFDSVVEADIFVFKLLKIMPPL